MFTRVSLVLAALVAATALTTACPPLIDEPPPKKSESPATPFPQVGTIVALDGKEETVEYTVVVPVLVRERFHVGPGRNRKETIVFDWQHKQITRKSKIDRLKFTDATGKPVPTLDAWKRLEIGTTFFVSTNGQPVPAAQLKMIARDALVVVDFDNVILERIIQELQRSGIDKEFDKGFDELPPRPFPKLR